MISYGWSKADQENVKGATSELMFPYISENRSCTGMLLTNLADPEWIQVPCEKPIASHILCSSTKNVTDRSIRMLPNLERYDDKCIVIGKVCHTFLWHLCGQSVPSFCSKMNNDFYIQQFKFLFEAVQKFPLVFIPGETKDYRIPRNIPIFLLCTRRQ